jgi:exodeoxyribonuclease V gamma subunit
MLSLRFSNRYERLADQLVTELVAQRSSPFDAPLVIVPSLALQQDITRRVADRIGVAAHLRFSLPGSWLWSLLPVLVPTRAKRPPFERDELGWRCFKCLSDPKLVAAEPVLDRYLEGADELQRLELANSAAHLMRSYANWRPEWLSAWQDGASVPSLADSPHERWQARLWRAVSEDLGIGKVHPMALFRKALQLLPAGDTALHDLPSRVHLFCIDELPPLALGMVEALGRHIEVEWYALNPCEAFWFDTVSPRRLARMQQLGRAEHAEVGHALLATMAPRSSVNLARLLELDPAFTTQHFETVEPHQATVLSALQASILHLIEPPPGAWRDLVGAACIEVHACHSLTRELEVLHDRLLSQFTESSELRPGDVLVLVPDIEEAAPLVDAVFGTRRESGNLPYRITGRSVLEDDAGLRCLLLALAENGADWRIGKALELLAEPIVQARFGLDEDDLRQLHRWLDESGSRRGLDRLDEASATEGAHPSLLSGLERLVLGFALPDGSTAPLGSIAPISAAEGSDVDIFAAWSSFLEVLQQLAALSGRAFRAAQWQTQLIAIAGKLVSNVGRFTADWLLLQSTLAETCDKLASILGDQPLGLPILRHALNGALEGRAAAATPGGSITFAGFDALHPLPYKIVAALGLNDGAVPPRSRAIEHDLLRVAPREGDPSTTDSARERFLGLILSARDQLHLSYTGRSIKDNSALLPSPLITELLDWITPRLAAEPFGPTELAAARNAVFVEQPLQPFSATLFDPEADARRRSHEAQWMPQTNSPPQVPLADSLLAADSADDVDDEAEEPDGDQLTGLPFFASPLPTPELPGAISLDALASFISHPARYVLQRRLELDTWLSDELPGHDEPDAVLAARDRHLAHFAVESLLAGDSLPSVEQALRHHPRMPFGSQAVHAARKLVTDHRALAEGIKAMQASTLDDIEVDLLLPTSLGPIKLQGRLRGLVRAPAFDAGLLDWRGSEPRASETLRFWVQHLALCAALPAPKGAAAAVRSRLLHAHGVLEFVDCTSATEQLCDLAECFIQGQSEPLKFFPKTSWISAEELPSEKILQCWEGRDGRPGERDDPSIALAFRGRTDCLDDEFDALAKRILRPLLDHLRTSGDVQ